MADKPITFTFDDAAYQKSMAFIRAMKQAGPRVIKRELNAIAFKWEKEIKRHMPVDMGIAKNSIQVRKAEEDENGHIVAEVGGNVPHLVWLEFGAEKARGLMKALTVWKPGMDPIIHWYAKDMPLEELAAKRDKAKKFTTYLNYYKRLHKATDSNTEEFAPPFRGSWQRISEDLIRRLRRTLAQLMREGKVIDDGSN